MSMLATYVQVSPEELAAFQDDPSSVGDLFHEPSGEAFGRLLASPATRGRIERLAPRLLAGTVAGLDPALQESLAKHFGAARDALAGEDGGAAIFELMKRRGLIGDEAAEPTGQPERDRRRRLSLDKAWHGLHYLLSGQVEPTAGPAGSVILGGTELGDDDLGYGPARCFDAAQVAEIGAELDRSGIEDELRGRYNPARMATLGIYPGGWERASELDWLLKSFRELRDFFHEAAEQEQAVVTCLV